MVTYTSHEEGGYRYGVFVADLPEAAEGGLPGTHKLVAVFGPWLPTGVAHVFAKDGYLSREYVSEKLGLSVRVATPEIQIAATRAVAKALGREAIHV